MGRWWWPFWAGGDLAAGPLELPPEQWVRSEGGLGGRPLKTKFNHALKPLAGRPPWLHFVGITAFFRHPGEDGLPGEEEARELVQLESHLRREFRPDEGALTAGVIITGGWAQFVVYAADPEGAKERYRRLRREFPAFELQLDLVEDSAWAVYGQFVHSARR